MTNAHGPVPPILISALHYAWETPEEAFERCAGEFGLEGIELSIVRGGDHPHLREDEHDRVRELREAYGLRLSGHVWTNLPPLGLEGAATQLREWRELACHLGLEHLVIHGGTHDDRRAGTTLMTEAIAEVADEYAAAGVVLCVENHYAWEYRGGHELFGAAEDFAALFERVEGPAVAFCLDYGHSHMTGNTLELLERVGDRLAYAHLADNMGEHDDHVAFGQGTVPWREVLTATRETGFRGPFVVEFPVRETQEPLRSCVRMLREVYTP